MLVPSLRVLCPLTLGAWLFAAFCVRLRLFVGSYGRFLSSVGLDKVNELLAHKVHVSHRGLEVRVAHGFLNLRRARSLSKPHRATTVPQVMRHETGTRLRRDRAAEGSAAQLDVGATPGRLHRRLEVLHALACHVPPSRECVVKDVRWPSHGLPLSSTTGLPIAVNQSRNVTTSPVRKHSAHAQLSPYVFKRSSLSASICTNRWFDSNHLPKWDFPAAGTPERWRRIDIYRPNDSSHKLRALYPATARISPKSSRINDRRPIIPPSRARQLHGRV